MPRIDSELRSRDLVQMLAEPTITEEPPPILLTTEFPRLLSANDSTSLSEQYGTFSGSDAGVYEVDAPNLIINPHLEATTGWAVVSDTTGGLGVAPDDTVFFPEGRTNRSARLLVSSSTGAGLATYGQVVESVTSPIYCETWVRLRSGSSTGVRVGLRFQRLDSSNNVLAQSSLVEHSTISSSWTRLQVSHTQANLTNVRIRLLVTLRTTASGQRADVNSSGMRLVEWTQLQDYRHRPVVGFSRVKS